MTALRSLVFNLAFYLNLIVLMILGLPLILRGRHGVFFMARLWGSTSVWLLEKICGLRVEYRGLENIPKGGYILAAKHESFLETFALLKYAPDFAIVLKRQLVFIPIFGLYLVGARQIAIDRSRGHTALSQIIAQAREVLRARPAGLHLSRGHAPPARRAAALQVRRRRDLRGNGRSLPSRRAQHRPLLGPARLHPPPGRRRDRISAADSPRPRPRRVRRAAASDDRDGLRAGSTRKRSPPIPASRRFWPPAPPRSTRPRPASRAREA